MARIFWLIFVCFFSTFSIHAQEGLSNKEDNTEVRLQERNWKGKNLLVGTLDLGDIRAGSRKTVSIQLRNDSHQPVVLQRISPSCACSELRISRQTISPTELSSAGSLTIATPQVLGDRFRIAEILMFDADEVTEPVAVIEVIADIYRPFSIRSGRMIANVGLDAEQVIPIDIDLHPEVRLSDIELSIDRKEIVATLERKSKARGTISIRGARSDFLDNPTATVRILHVGERFEDKVLVDLIDSSKLRLLKSSLTENKSFVFRIFRQSGIAADDVKVYADETAIRAELVQIGGKIVDITVRKQQIPSEKSFKIMLFEPTDKLHQELVVTIPTGENDD